MARTQIGTTLIEDASVRRVDINTTTTTQALITKVIVSSPLTISSSGVDSGTGDVTLGLSTANLVTSFNTRVGAVTLSGSDVTTALGFTPISGESDTLAIVTGRGASTTNAITVGGLTVATNLIHTDTTNGRVGIGTTAPQSKLEVRSSGSGNAGAVITLNRVGAWGSAYSGLKLNTDDAGTDWWNVGMLATTTNTFNIGQNGGAMMSILVNGNIGIGTTSPTTILHLSFTSPELSFTATGLNRTSTIGMGDGANFYIKNTSAGNMYISDINSVYIAYGASSQNVGIGTTNPADKLDVNGNVNATGYKVNGVAGFNGTVTILQPVPNPPVTFTIVNGIITNVV